MSQEIKPLSPEECLKLTEASIQILRSRLQQFEDLPEDEKELLKGLFLEGPNKKRRWRDSTVATYYKEAYAKQLKIQLDLMEADPEKLSYLWDNFKMGLSRKSLIQRLQQSWLYLIDNLDTPDQKYLKLRGMVQIRKHPKGVVLEWRMSKISVDLTATPITPEKLLDRKEWKAQVDKFLETSKKGEVLDIKVTLIQEDISWLKEYLFKDDRIVEMNISKHRIYLINDPDIKAAIKNADV